MPLKRVAIYFSIVSLFLFYAVSGEAAPKRIVSMTPVGTEILFDLGQGDNIIAVTDFCDYPPQALKKPKIGGYAEINYEALIAMKTDLLVLQDMHRQLAPQLTRLKIPYVILKQNSIEEIYDAITVLGKICGEESRAASRVASIRADFAKITVQTARMRRPRVMLCVSRELSEQRIRGFYIAGVDNFYNELINLAGGKNVYAGGHLNYPCISVGGLLQLNPDVIIDLVGDRNYYHSREPVKKDEIFSKRYLENQWRAATAVNAVKKGQIAILEGTVYLRPGPRVGQIVRAFARAIHPEVRW